MKVHASHYGYPVFSMPDGIEYWRPMTWSEMIDEIPADYFVRTARVPEGCEPGGVRAIDCAVFNEEGDEFVLSLVELKLASGDTLTLFLPLMRTILSTSDELHHTEIDRKLARDRGLVAFGIETRSEFSGERTWVVYDAFLDEEILHVLLGLFWPDESFYALDTTEGESGTFRFRTVRSSPPPPRSTPRLHVDEEGHLTIDYGGHTLSIRADVAAPASEAATPGDFLGRLTYEGDARHSLTIGVLHRTAE